MRVLLLGEYSGVHQNLARGLRRLGVRVDVASAGDSWKRIAGDINFGLGLPGVRGAVLRNVLPFVHLPRLRSYDLVQIVNPQLLTTRFGINSAFFAGLLSGIKGKVFLLACGCDVATNEYFRHTHPFPQICAECKELDLPSARCLYEFPSEIAFERRLLERVDGIIPTGVEYARAYRALTSKLRRWLPLPFDTVGVPYAANSVVDGVTRIFHGLNRDGFKGTRHVRQAFELAARELGDKAAFQTFGRMPLQAYLARTAHVNVVVDQIFGVSYGMNALFQMARGKVVVGGGEPGALAEVGLTGCPVKYTGASIERLAAALMELCRDPVSLATLGEQGRAFVDSVHNSTRVAQMFLDEWTR